MMMMRDDCLLLIKQFGVASSLGFLLLILKLETVEVEPLNGSFRLTVH
jgi:hypothetical protein